MTTTLIEILIVLVAAVVVTLLFVRLRLPPLVGLFVAGVLIGPNAFGLIENSEDVDALAEVGIIFLLFALGLEFSFRRMARLARVMLVAGPLQVVLTGTVAFGVGLACKLSITDSLVLGILVALSSTAVVLKSMTERGEVDTPLGRNALGILLFQDILFVPLMLILPLLGGNPPDLPLSTPLLIAAVIGLVVMVFVLARWVVPWLLFEAARTRSADTFLMVVVAVCFAVAAASAQLGLSLALGAFLAGLIISESQYSHQALGLVEPFRNLLVSFFFVSVGMLLDPSLLAHHWWIVLLGTLGVIVVKTITGTVAIKSLRCNLRISVSTGLSLAQVGEFSFVLAVVAASNGLLSEDLRQDFLAVAVLSMALTPAIMSLASPVYRALRKLGLERRDAEAGTGSTEPVVGHANHLLIVGYGVNGRNLARAAREFDFPYVVVEMNPQTVRRELAQNEPIYYGDATNEAVLLKAGAKRARAAAVVIGDAGATRGIVAQLHRLNPSLHIIARTRFVSEVQPLVDLGASDVVPEEFETSVEIFRRTAEHFALPEEAVAVLEESIRSDQYALLRERRTRQGG